MSNVVAICPTLVRPGRWTINFPLISPLWVLCNSDSRCLFVFLFLEGTRGKKGYIGPIGISVSKFFI